MLAPGRIDWRWASAADATEYSDSEAVSKLQSADPATREAFLFKRALDAGLDVSRWPSYSAAYELYSSREKERLFVEGLLLAGAPNELVADMSACDPEDVQAFHDLFFDVRPRLDKPGWVVAHLFGGTLYGAINPRDKVAQLHRIAWLGGEDVFLSYYSGEWNPKLGNNLAALIKGVLAKQSLLASMCITGRDEINIDVLRVFLETTKEDIAKTVGGGSKEQEAAVMEFIKSVPLTVADPTDQRNLNLPAREKRAHDYLEAPNV